MLCDIAKNADWIGIVNTMTFKGKNKWDDSEELLFTCDCGSIEHQFHVSTVDDFVGFSIILNHRTGIFRRIWAAIKYVLKYDKRGWMFEEVLLTSADQRELASALSKHAERTGKVEAA